MDKEVILTGLRSNGELHLGSYLGAILPMVDLQKKHAGQYQLNMFVPDLHSFTTPIDHGNLYENTIQNLKIYIAAGLDINQPDTFIYRQSFVPAHSELTWILDCFTGFGEMTRMTQFKDKSASLRIARLSDITGYKDPMKEMKAEEFETVGQKLEQRTTVGLFNYPVLMAADILLYGAMWVPVGEDQRQHVEFARDLAIRMNNKFGELFALPKDNKKQTEFAGREEPVRIRSLRDPGKKMSKSISDPAGTILLSDSTDDAVQKIMSATTDSEKSIHYDWEKQPGISNLLQIYALLSERSLTKVAKEWEGKSSYGDLKKAVAEKVKDFLADFQQKLAQVSQHELMQKLEADEGQMNEIAKQTLQRVQRAVGLRPKI